MASAGKVGTLLGSLTSAILGCIMLLFVIRRTPSTETSSL
jgi:Na+/H+ antiporter NhaA